MSTKVNHHMTRMQKRKLRVRAKLHGTAIRPRVSVFRSSEHTSLQAINDEAGATLVSATEKEVQEKGNKSVRAMSVAKVLAEKMKKAKITTAVFDRGSYRYHGRVKAVADVLREAGIQV